MARWSEYVLPTLPTVLFGILLFSFGRAHATPIYKSIDAMGNVSYSTTPPADAVHTERMEVTGGAGVDAQAVHDAIIDEIRATAAQLEADRIRREQARESARSKERDTDKEKRVSLPPQPIIQYYPVYPLRYGYPHQPRRHRHPSGRQTPERK